MIFNFRNGLAVLLLILGIKAETSAQEISQPDYRFTMEKLLPATDVKNQYQSGTCWSFASLSMIESELLRTGKGEYNLSEMYTVRNTYLEKADKYVRMHGTINFSSGGEANDVTATIKSAGIMPDEVYPGGDFDISKFDFGRMDRELKDYVESLVRYSRNDLDMNWKKEYEAILDKHLGPVPESFTWNGRSYTPHTFAESLELDMEEYYLVGSYTHHPYYDKFILEIPDNWSWEYVYNVPVDEMIDILESSLVQGYSVVWAADVTDEGFAFYDGLALIDEHLIENYQKDEFRLLRQELFDNYDTQDDHAMHIVGMARDNAGNRFYYVKNSWGQNNPYDGYLYVSEDYMRLKTISFMINKEVLSEEMKVKLSIN